MTDGRRLPASAGAEWLLGGFRLFRQAPLGLGSLGLIWGAIALLVPWSMGINVTLFLLLEVVLVLAQPMLMGGLIRAERSVDQGGKAIPAHLLEGFRNGKAPRLLATLVPQIVAALVCALLLVLLVGGDWLSQIAQAFQTMRAQAQPDPSLLAGMPVGRLMLWMVLVVVVAVLASFFTFVAVPEIMLTDTGPWDAMRRSFSACLRNVGALLVFLVLSIIAVVGIYLAVMIVAVIVKLVAGEQAMEAVAQLLATAILMPVFTSAMYVAWKQMLDSTPTAATTPVPETVGGFEA